MRDIPRAYLLLLQSIKHPKLDSDHQIYFVSLPVVLPPSNSDPFEWKGQPHTCVKGKSGHLCCNRTLEEVIISTYEDVRNRPHFSHYNVHKITTEVQKVIEIKLLRGLNTHALRWPSVVSTPDSRSTFRNSIKFKFFRLSRPPRTSFPK